MPNDPMTNPASSSLNNKPEVRRALPAGPDKPQWLEGKLTYIGLVLATIGSIGKIFGLNLPTSEADGFLHLISDNWETIATGIGLLTAAWGRIRINFRKVAPLLLFGLMLSQLSAAEKIKLGWKSNPNHAKGLTQIAKHPKFKAELIPVEATLEQHFYRTDQGNRGACVGFSAFEATDAAIHLSTNRWVYPSGLDTYQQLLVKDGTFPRDEGSYTSTALFVLTMSKITTEQKWPYSRPLEVLPPTCVVNSRSIYAIKAYDVPHDDGGISVKRCIALVKAPVMTGGYWPQTWMRTLQTKIGQTTYHYATRAAGATVGGHEVVVVGYKDDLVIEGITGWAQIHNHWAGWGDDRGCAWVPQRDLFNPRRFEDNGAVEAATGQP